MQRRELFGPQHAERFENLRADFVLPAVAARGGRERRPVALAAVQHHEQPVVLIVGMRGGVHEDAGVAEMPERQPERDMPALVVERNHPHLCAKGERGRTSYEGGDQQRTCGFHKGNRTTKTTKITKTVFVVFVIFVVPIVFVVQKRSRNPSWNFRCS